MKDIYKYEGYLGYGLDGFNMKSLINLRNIITQGFFSFDNLDQELSQLDRISVEEIKSTAKKICDDFFNISTIDYINLDTLNANLSNIQSSTNAYELYEKIKGVLVSKSPFDLDVRLVDGHAMTGQIVKPLLITPNGLNEENRKVYFSEILLGNETNLLSIPTYVHEIAHAEQEKNIGYADDLLNREIISIFLEKVVADELDKSGKILRLAEQTRFLDLGYRYTLLYNPQISEDDKIDNFMYIKSILVAEKLFDMYKQERKQKNKDKYIDDINLVFDGKIKVEDIVAKRCINIRQCQDLQLIKRHLGK